MFQFLSSYNPQGCFLILLLIFTTFSLSGLLGIWSGLGRGHWFFRLLPAVGMVALPLTISGYELIVMFCLQLAGTIIPLFMLRKFRSRESTVGENGISAHFPGKTQFFLRDLLLLTVIVALLSSILTQIPLRIWQDGLYFAYGLGLAALTLLSAWIGLGRARLWIRLVLLVFCLPTLLIVVFIALARIQRPSRGIKTKTPFLKTFSRATLVILLVLIGMPPAFFYCQLLIPLPIPKKTILPDHNHYQELDQVAQALVSAAVPQDDDSVQLHQNFVLKYRKDLDKAHAALQLPCRIQLRYNADDMNIGFVDIRQLARAIYAEGRLARIEGRPGDASRIFLDELRLDNAVSQGGLFVHSFVGSAVAGLGMEGIAEIRGSLSADQCRQVISDLEKIERQREPPQDVIIRDDYWTASVFSSLPERLYVIISRLQGNSISGLFECSMRSHTAKRQLLITELALRCYQLENGRPAETLGDLVPKYLSTLPQDPFSEKPLIYRRTSSGYLLYSVGPDGKDDGGQAASSGWKSQGDIFLDAPGKNKKSKTWGSK